MKKFFISVFFTFSIGLLVVSLMLLTAIFLWENRAVIAKNFGIHIKDDCKISDSQLQCGYINVKSENFSLKLQDTKVRLDILKFFKRSEPFIFVKVNAGKIDLKIKKQKKNRTKDPTNYLFFLIYFVKSEINRLDIDMQLPQEKFILKDFSFVSSYNSFHIKRPFEFALKEFSGTVQNLSGVIEENSIKIRKFRGTVNGNSLSGEGNFDYDGNFAFKGSLEGDSFQMKNVILQDFQILFSVDRYRGFLKGDLHIFSKSLRINDFFVKGTEGTVRFSGESVLNGNLKIKINSLQLKKLKGSNALYDGKISFSLKDRLFKTGGSLSVSSVSYDSFQPVPLKSNVNIVYRDRKLKVNGTAYSGDISVPFKYENRKLTLTSEGLNIKQFAVFLRPVDVEGKVWGKAVIDFNNKTITADFNGENINLYGIHFEEGKFLSEFSIKENSGKFSLNLTGKDAYCFINGKLFDKKIDADITFDNISTTDLVYGQRYHFGGRLAGTGKIYGYIPDFAVSLTGTAYSFYYDGINLKNVNYNFLFENSSKNIRLSFKADNTAGMLTVNLKPFSLYLSLDFANSDVSNVKNFLKKKIPAVFSHITPQRATGTVKVSIKEKRWKISTQIQKAKVMIDRLGDYVFVSASGEFSNSNRFMEISFFRKSFTANRYRLNEISGNVSLSDDRLTTLITGKGLENFDSMKMEVYSVFELYSKNIKGEVKFFLKKGEFSNHIDSSFKGKIESIKGIVKERGFIGKKPFINTDLTYEISIDNSTVKMNIKTDSFSITLPEETTVNLHDISGKINLPFKKLEKATGELSISSLTLSTNHILLLKSSPLKITLKDGRIISKPFNFSGIITGEMKRLSYNIINNEASIFSEGTLDRDFLSIVAIYLNTSGKIRYIVSFDGNINNITKKLNFYLISDSLDIRTPYTVGIVKLKKVIFKLSEGIFTLNASGKATNSVLGESIVRIKGKGNIEKFHGSFDSYTQLFPVKFKNIFQGTVNSNLKLEIFSRDNIPQGTLKGKVSVSGRLNLKENMESILKKKSKTAPVENSKDLENLSLDFSIESYIPLYIHGKWGKAYAEFDLKVRGTGKNPHINGSINIIYGEIFFMKNRYNIDFANIKIIDNEPYISARVSTSVADTFIFIDISGSAYNPKINFFSNPPKSKNEILSILILKDTPSALENMPVFKTVGRLLYTILPFKPSEETGLFNTGFEINILPQYSPSTGISASIYGKRNLTRRIFVALSKPLGQVEEEKIGGWYGIGVRLKERTSFQYKFFETGNQEFGIVFNLPFDF